MNIIWSTPRVVVEADGPVVIEVDDGGEAGSTPRVVVEADGPPKYIHTGVTPLANLWLAQHGQSASDVLSQVAASPAADIPVAMGQVHYVWIDDSDLAVLFIASANNERAPFPAREEWRFVLALRRERQMVEMELAG